MSAILFFNYSTFSTGRVIMIFFKDNFFSRVETFLGTNVVFRSLFCFGSSLSKTDLIFLANIVSAGETASGVLGLGVILYTCRNPSGYLMLFWVLVLTCLQNVQPGRLILGDIAVRLCVLFGRFRKTPWIRLMWIGFRCRWPHNLLHRTAQTVHVGTQ